MFLLTAMCCNFFGCVGFFLKAAERARAQRELRTQNTALSRA